MNKKIKVIELINKIYANLDVPKRLKKNDYIFEYCEEEQDFYDVKKCTYLICGYAQSHEKWLDVEVEILEDEEEIDIQGIKEMEYLEDYEADKTDIRLNRDKINDLVKAVKQLEKKIDKED